MKSSHTCTNRIAAHGRRFPDELQAGVAGVGFSHSMVSKQLRLSLREGGFDLNARGVRPNHSMTYANPVQPASSNLSSAVHCHDALADGLACLHPFVHLQYNPANRLSSPPRVCTSAPLLWRAPAASHMAMNPAAPQDPALLPISVVSCHHHKRYSARTTKACAAHINRQASHLLHAVDSTAQRAHTSSLSRHHTEHRPNVTNYIRKAQAL